MKTNTVRFWLRLEAALELAVAATAYHHLGGSWLTFAALFLLPDLSMAAYWRNPAAGAFAYNLAHTYVLPAVGYLLFPSPLWLIWAAHVAFDRTLGYGLKHPTAFADTHLGKLNR